MLNVIYYMSYPISYILYAMCPMLYAICHMSYVKCQLYLISYTCHMSSVVCYMLHATCYMISAGFHHVQRDITAVIRVRRTRSAEQDPSLRTHPPPRARSLPRSSHPPVPPPPKFSQICKASAVTAKSADNIE